MDRAAVQSRRWLHFSLGSLLFVSLLIGGLVAGYQSGYRGGYNSGAAQRYDETQSAETYSTAMVIWPDLSADERSQAVEQLTNLITTTVAPDVWSTALGNEIRDFAENQTLVITAPGYVHREIRDLFSQLERLKTGGMADQLLPLLQQIASQGKSQGHPIPLDVPTSSRMALAWIEQYYDATIAGTSKHWGSPTFKGRCTDAGFPAWSLDQRIATWRRSNGLSYLALRYGDDGKPQIIAGWRAKS